MPPGEIVASPAIKAKLRRLGLARLDDLVLHLPARYEDETVITAVSAAPNGASVQVQTVVLDVSVQFRPRRQLVMRVADASGELYIRFLNFYGSQLKQFEKARDETTPLRFFGEIRQGFFGLEMVHPRYRPVAQGTLPDALTPIYATTAGLSQTALRRQILLALVTADLTESLDPTWRDAHGLMAFAEAVHLLHQPPSKAMKSIPDPELQGALQQRTHPAWRRIKFDELLAQQISLRRAYLARRGKGAPALIATGALAGRLMAALPFSLTEAQKRVMIEIGRDLTQIYPMQRLLQGDVGSGKTVIAALAACQAIEAGYQVALMAPTEILAEQHYLKLSDWLTPLGVKLAWLSGSLRKSVKRMRQAQTAEASQLVVGTHALIQERVDFARLGLVIIDEQHRFGVAQRLELRKKGANPHQLMMSATPIPRTLAMSYYADLDVSVLDEMPPGRQPIRTKLVADGRRDEVIERVRAIVGEGRQVYWVCPLIEESEKIDLQTALDIRATLMQELPDLRIGLVHGRLKSNEKAARMAAFVSGEIDILVATTVIEVGVDVPNASLMVIEHAERFGLSQLHQLRGRVGRGAHDSVCVLLYQTPLSSAARERLKVIYENSDGFEIARQDLRLRGPGEFIGSRQSGLPLLRYADLETDIDLIEMARTAAEQLLNEAPARARHHLQRWFGGREEMLKA